MKGGAVDMPARGSKNMEFYERVSKETNEIIGTNKTVRSQLKASENYDKNNVDNVRLRVPKGWKEQMQAYVESSDKYNSVNAMLCELIRKELNIEE